jgi:hypothetical protein
MSLSLLATVRRSWDADAGVYLQAVEAADGQSLEPYVAQAINQFVLGCKADGNFTPIAAACIVMGARTISGALVPLVGPTPTPNGYVSADYSRKTGLKANGTQWIYTNRQHESYAQNSNHLCVFFSENNTLDTARGYGGMFGSHATGGTTHLMSGQTTPSSRMTVRLSTAATASGSVSQAASPGFFGATRTSSSQINTRGSGVEEVRNMTSDPPITGDMFIHARSTVTSGGGVPGTGFPAFQSNGRLAFYSLGGSLASLATMDARLTTLSNTLQNILP